MAFAYIQEFEDLSYDARGNVVSAGQQLPLATQRVSYTTSTQSAALQKGTRFVRIVVDTNSHFLFGTNPTAVNTNGNYIPAGSAEYFGVNEGIVSQGALKIAFVTT